MGGRLLACWGLLGPAGSTARPRRGIRMDFRILGALEVASGRGPVDLPGAKQRRLLAVLLIHANQVVSSDRLIDDLWADQPEPPPSAVGTLQSYVSQLRRCLSRDEPASGRLLTRPPGYLLRVEAEELDATRFERLLREGRQALPNAPVIASALLAEAVSLWRGPALAEFADTPFARAERARLEELRGSAVEGKVEADLALGRHAELVGEIEALVAAYQAGRRLLSEELGIDPGRELRSLEEAILRQDPQLDWRAPQTSEAASRPGAPPSVPSPPVGSGSRPGGGRGGGDTAARAEPWVGRDAELAALEQGLADAAAGAGGVALVAGEPGIGKTRLAEVLAGRAARSGVRVVWAGCYEGEGAPAFWPWIQALRHLLGVLDPQKLPHLLGKAAGPIAQIVSEAAEAVPGLAPAPPLGPAAARFQLYDAVTRFLLRVSAAEPSGGALLLILDDLHWADAPSLQLLAFLAGQARRAPMFVVATYRDTDLDPARPLLEALAALSRHAAVRRMALQGLGPRQVGQLIAATTGTAPSRTLVAAVHDRTEGNPFFLAELVRLLDSQGGLSDQAAVVRLRSALPVGCRDVIRRRLALLPTDTAELLGVAAIVGRDFELEVLTEVTGQGDEQILAAVEAALAGRMLLESPGGVGCYRFSHALVRETLYEQPSALRRARLHQRIGDALERLPGPDLDGDGDRVVELAHHYLQAVPAGSGAKALRYALRAAELAAARLAYEQAEEHLRQAVELLVTMPASPERAEQELALQLRLAQLGSWTKSYAAPEVGQACARARVLCREVGDSDQVGPLWNLWTFYTVVPDYQVAQELAARLLEIGQANDQAAGQPASRSFLMAGHWALGVTTVQMGQARWVPRAQEHLQHGAALARTMDDQQLIALYAQHPVVTCQAFAAMACWMRDAPDQAAGLLHDTLTLARQLGHPYTLGFALFVDTWLGIYRQDIAHVRRRADEVIALAAEQGFPMFTALATITRGWALAEQGEPKAGVAEVRRGLAVYQATGAGMLRHFLLGLLAQAHRRARHLDDALAVLDEALAVSVASSEHFYQAELHRLKGELLLDLSADRLAEACKSLSQAVTVAHAQQALIFERRAAASLRRLTRP